MGKGNNKVHESLEEGNILRLAREFHGWNQTEFALKLDMKNSHLSEIESGKRPVSLKVLRRYAKVLSVPASSILFFMEKAKSTGEDTEFVFSRGTIEGGTLKMLAWIGEHLGNKNIKG